MPTSGNRLFPSHIKGFTLIEVVIGLGLTIVVILLWQPLLGTVQHFTKQDLDLISALQAEQDLQANVQDHQMAHAVLKNNQVWLDGKDKEGSKTYIFELYRKAGTNDGLVRVKSNGDGHVPLFTHLQAVKFQVMQTCFLYTLTLSSGQVFEGGVPVSQ